MSKISLIIVLLVCASGFGCSTIDKLLVLKHYGDNQDQTKRYIKKTEEFFDKLVRDVKDGRVKPGATKEEFMATYGSPVLTEEESSLKGGLVAVYRYPTYYFDTDKVYVYFDDNFKLVSYEYQPYKDKE